MIWRLIQFVVVIGGLGLLLVGIKWTVYSGDFGFGLGAGFCLGMAWFYLLYALDKRAGRVIELSEAQQSERRHSSGF